uniref:Uncharacterized protein n=1 Tax=Utricularia reniformis TaxID=192314 RepID=A0A1Y0B2G1_9LAMI|nr:hypothetical protein AEK19_MT1381 [Utricularia reniformis]ART31577.1 hypothetical protein AEK19_MT1381 [Utricularia reniformis]
MKSQLSYLLLRLVLSPRMLGTEKRNSPTAGSRDLGTISCTICLGL